MQNVSTYKRTRKQLSKVNDNYDKVMKEYARLSYLFDPTADKILYNRLLMDITIGNSDGPGGSSYNPDTATEPLWSNIQYKTMQDLTDAGIMHRINSAVVAVGTGDAKFIGSPHNSPSPSHNLKGTFCTQPLWLDLVNFGQRYNHIGLYKSYGIGFLAHTSNLRKYNLSTFGTYPTSISMFSYGIPNYSMPNPLAILQRDHAIYVIHDTTNNNIRLKRITTLSTQVTEQQDIPLNISDGKYISFVYDGFNYWCLQSPTKNNAVITYTKICSKDQFKHADTHYDEFVTLYNQLGQALSNIQYWEGLRFEAAAERTTEFSGGQGGYSWGSADHGSYTGTLPWN